MATCKDCLHYEACMSIYKGTLAFADKSCEHFADKSRFVELPCKVGDTVYRISKRYGKWEVLPRVAEGVGHFGDVNGETKWLIFSTTGDWLGQTVFLTREEAEAALAERAKTK